GRGYRIAPRCTGGAHGDVDLLLFLQFYHFPEDLLRGAYTPSGRVYSQNNPFYRRIFLEAYDVLHSFLGPGYQAFYLDDAYLVARGSAGEAGDEGHTKNKNDQRENNDEGFLFSTPRHGFTSS